MDDYATSMESIEDIRQAKSEEPLTRTEIQLYRKYTSRLSWLAANTRPDLALQL
jgi:hypothetical protein